MSIQIRHAATFLLSLSTLFLSTDSFAQTFAERIKSALFGNPTSTQGQGDYIGDRRGYVDGQGSVNSMACYESGGRDHQYPAGVKQAQRDVARSPNNRIAAMYLESYTQACGTLPQLYTQEEHQVWLAEEKAKNEQFRKAYEGSEMQKRDQAMLRLIEPVVEEDKPGSHNCNADEKRMYAEAKEIIRGGYNSGYSKNDLDGAHMTVELIENRCGQP